MKRLTGGEFTHDKFLDPDWKPGPGEKYKDGPKARMVVTRVKMYTVWYRYVGETDKQRSKGGWAMDTSEFLRRFGDQFPD